jgi:hypothetical protein
MTVVNFENQSQTHLPARAANLMFCLTLDDFSIEEESGVDRSRVGKICRSPTCDLVLVSQFSGGKRARLTKYRRCDASKPASPWESCDGRRLDTDLSGFDRTRPEWPADERNLIRDSAKGITPGVVVPRHGGAGHG